MRQRINWKEFQTVLYRASIVALILSLNNARIKGKKARFKLQTRELREHISLPSFSSSWRKLCEAIAERASQRDMLRATY
jgi:hypothetical protein